MSGSTVCRRGAAVAAVVLSAALCLAPAALARPAALASISGPPPVPHGAAAVGSLDPTTELRLAVVLAPRDPEALASFATAVSTPGSPRYRQYLDRGQFAATFGASPETIAAVQSVLRAQGLRPAAASDGLSIAVDTTAADAGRALHVGFARYRLSSGRVAFANTAGPELPAALRGSVQGVLGLNDLVARDPVPAQVGAVGSGPQACAEATSSAAARLGYAPAQFAAAYGMSGLYDAGDRGQGVSVALFELEPNSTSDIAHYQSCFGTNAGVSYTRVDAGAGNGAGSGEAALDIEDVIGLAPSASVRVYQGPNSEAGGYDTLARMVEDDASQVISTSWGACEPEISAAEFASEATLFEQAAAQGQSVLAAAGDSGSEDCRPNGPDGLAVDDPASQPYVTGVGGTALTISTQPAESVWNDHYGAGGGGISRKWTMPAYQAGAVSSLDSSAAPCGAAAGSYCREVPDVAADAAPASGYLVYHGGSWKSFGGTSAAAPLWAAIVALADASHLGDCAPSTPVGFLNPGLYDLAGRGAFSDVTTGNNDFTGTAGGSFAARVGYDLATGLGTPLAYASATQGLVPQLCDVAAPSAQTISPSAGPAAGGTTVTITGSHLSLPGTTVAFGTSPATGVQASGDGTLTAVAPPGIGTVAVTVTNAYGTSTSLSYSYTASPTPTPTPAPTAVPSAAAPPTASVSPLPAAVSTPTPVPTPRAAPAATRRLVLAISGALHYRLQVEVASSDVRLTRDRHGELLRIAARLKVRGETGHPAALTYSLAKSAHGWTGTITIDEPAAKLHERFSITGAPRLHANGLITGFARAKVHHRRATLRFEFAPATTPS